MIRDARAQRFTIDIPDHAGRRQEGPWRAAWCGCAFLPGHEEGAESIGALIGRLATEAPPSAVTRLRGVFGLWLENTESGECWVSTDGGGLFKIFYTDRACSDNLLSIVDTTADVRLRDAEVLEFLQCGVIVDNKTFVDGVSKLQGNEILYIRKERGKLHVVQKDFSGSDGESGAIAELVEDFGRSCARRRASLDLTGGLDSRVLLCLLERSGFACETGCIGGEGSPDVRIAGRIADMVGRKFYAFRHVVADVDAGLRRAFLAGGGFANPVHLLSNFLHMQQRQQRGVELVVHGGGGELYRDHAFVHEFPRYRSRRANLERLYRLRLAPVPLSADLLGEDLRAELRRLPRRVVDKLRRFERATAAETCSAIYYYGRYSDFFGGFYSAYIRSGVNVFAPFLDRAIAEDAIRLPPWQRWYALWHRRMLTRHCPELARVATMDGMTASAEWRDLLRDGMKYGEIQLRRAARKVSERILKKSLFYRVGVLTAEPPEYRPAVRRSETFLSAFETLRDRGIFAKSASPEEVASAHLGRVIALGLLLERARGGGSPP